MEQDDRMEYPEIDTCIFGELMFFQASVYWGVLSRGGENKQQVHLLAHSLRSEHILAPCMG